MFAVLVAACWAFPRLDKKMLFALNNVQTCLFEHAFIYVELSLNSAGVSNNYRMRVSDHWVWVRMERKGKTGSLTEVGANLFLLHHISCT